ncbi:MAG: hypothetical protein DMG51_10660, partial [Acidobacteria bacterium]
MPFTGTFERDPLAEEFQANRFNIWTLCFRTAYCSLRSRSKHAPHVALGSPFAQCERMQPTGGMMQPHDLDL